MTYKDFIPGFNSLAVPYHFAQSLVAGIKYGFPGKSLRIIGVTGTNGKTTTCFMLWKMLNEAGHKTGLMTTVAWGVPGLKKTAKYTPDSDGLVKQIEHMTTADSFTLNRRIKTIKDAGAEFLILEVTSHALAQYRTLGIPIEIAIMTNVTHDHLDYHRTFDRYLRAKTKLFKKAGYGIVNSDDPSADEFILALPQPTHTSSYLASGDNYTSYGIKSGQIRAKSIKLTAKGVNYTSHDILSLEDTSRARKKSQTLAIKTQIPGQFNVYNSLAAVCVGRKLGLSDQQIQDGIYALKEVEGRMNRLDFGQDFEVIVDYAHTPDAFEKVFTSVKPPLKSGRVISLFGGAGRRDESTREERGGIAAKFSDLCIITEDDSRDEDPLAIMEQFKNGCKKAGMSNDKILMIKDRGEAIKKAISLARKGDLVLILGKGHEKTILRADGPHPFEDLKVAASALKSRTKS